MTGHYTLITKTTKDNKAKIDSMLAWQSIAKGCQWFDQYPAIQSFDKKQKMHSRADEIMFCVLYLHL